ncbi:hypothetical protein BpHYR1_012551 [Brachionus plicatilis]|uniref:Uncharacterized protein n=1 Tax=Brachionus plicatilis TaxID=10195 RepID=A0A3M7PIT0_BRAPC|nr:hypothetical protein BpHYR1_012551 [Brachionus plicatilis]
MVLLCRQLPMSNQYPLVWDQKQPKINRLHYRNHPMQIADSLKLPFLNSVKKRKITQRRQRLSKPIEPLWVEYLIGFIIERTQIYKL